MISRSHACAICISKSHAFAPRMLLLILAAEARVGAKPGLWTLDWTVDWTLDCILDCILDRILDLTSYDRTHAPEGMSEVAISLSQWMPMGT